MPVTCTSDGGPNLTAKVVEDMMKDYGSHHRISSVANPHANARAELGIKTVKRRLKDNVSARGTLDRAAVSRALLQLRNTLDRDTKLSPAKALYGRELRDFLPRPGSALMGEMWMNLADAREQALACRATNAEKQWSEHTKALPPLKVGDTVMVQNQEPEGPGHDEDQPAGVQYHGDVRGGRGETTKYRDFVQKIGASSTYAQIVSGLGGRGHSW